MCAIASPRADADTRTLGSAARNLAIAAQTSFACGQLARVSSSLARNALTNLSCAVCLSTAIPRTTTSDCALLALGDVPSFFFNVAKMCEISMQNGALLTVLV